MTLQEAARLGCPSPANLAVSDAARELGLREGTIRAWIAQGRIGYHKLGKAVRIPRAEIERILRESLIPAKVAR